MSPNDVVKTGGGGVDGHLLDCLKILFCIENYELLVWTLILEFKNCIFSFDFTLFLKLLVKCVIRGIYYFSETWNCQKRSSVK